jgi:hypothetical protein
VHGRHARLIRQTARAPARRTSIALDDRSISRRSVRRDPAALSGASSGSPGSSASAAAALGSLRNGRSCRGTVIALQCKPRSLPARWSPRRSERAHAAVAARTLHGRPPRRALANRPSGPLPQRPGVARSNPVRPGRATRCSSTSPAGGSGRTVERSASTPGPSPAAAWVARPTAAGTSPRGQPSAASSPPSPQVASRAPT